MNDSTVFRSVPLLVVVAALAVPGTARSQIQPPGFSISLSPETAGLGSCTELIVAIENTEQVETTQLTFTLDLPDGVALTSPANVRNGCGGIVSAPDGGSQLSLTDGSVPAGMTCTIQVSLVLLAEGPHTLTTSDLTSSAGNSGSATATLDIPANDPSLGFTKTFLDNPIDPGGTSRLEFTITNNSPDQTFTDLSFTDDLDATLPGLRAVDLPTTGGLVLDATFDGGGNGNVLGPTWDYLDQLENENGNNDGYPMDGDGNAWNTSDFDVVTSTIGTWQSGNAPLQGGLIDGFPPGTPDVLGGIDAAPNGENLVTTYLFRQSFLLDDAQSAIGDWLIEYLIDDGAIVYVNGVEIFRTPNMPAGPVTTTTLSGLGDESGFSSAAVDLTGLLSAGTNSIAVEVHQTALDSSDVGFSLGLLPASESPTGGFAYSDDTFEDTDDADFSDGALEPAGGFTGGGLSVTTGGKGFFASLLNPPSSGGWSRTFTVDTAESIDIRVRYRLVFDETYEDDEFGQALLEIDGTRLGNGPGNSLAQFTGGTGADQDTGWQTFTTNVFLTAGEHTILFGAYNNKSSQESEITQAFFDDVQIGTPETPAPVCGPGSQIVGSDILTFSGGTLAPGQSCSFSVGVEVPVTTPIGSYLNTTSLITTVVEDNTLVGSPATDTLMVEPIPPAFSKSFLPSSIALGGVSTLTFTIDNSASRIEALGFTFTDTLPDGLVIADPPNASTTCAGGTIIAVAGTSVINFVGRRIAAGETCTVTVDVTGGSPGTFINTTGDLISSLGNSGPASAELTINPPPVFTKSFAPESINAGQIAVLTFTIDNSASELPATNLSFTDTLPAGLVVSNPTNATTTCVGGTISAIPGGGSVSFSGGTVPAGAVCTLSLEVTSLEGGTFSNTSGDLTSSLGNSGSASETLEVRAVVEVTLSMSESADPVTAGSGPANLTYVVTATNDGPSTATGIVIGTLLTLPAGVAIEGITPSTGDFNLAEWTIPTLAPGASATLAVVVTVGPSTQAGLDVISHRATLNAVNELNNVVGVPSAMESTSVTTAVNLQVTGMDSADPVTAGSGPGNLVHTVTVTNAGPSDATGVELSEVLTIPAGVAIDSVTPTDGNFIDSIWSLPALPAGASQELTITLTTGPSAPAGDDLIVSATTLTAVDQSQIATGDESATISTSIRREVDLAIAIAESRDPVLAGYELPENLRHVVTVSNNGPSDASGVELNVGQVLPPGVTLVSASPPPDHSFEPPYWTVGDLPRGESASLVLYLSVPGDVAGGVFAIATSAAVSAAREPLLNTADDADFEATSIVSPNDVAINSGPIALDYQTSLFKQTIAVTNNNPLAISAFRVLVDGLPAGVSVHNARGTSGDGADLLFNEALAPGASVNLVAEYFQLDASGGFDPTFAIELLDPADAESTTDGVALDRCQALPSGDILVEFASVIGGVYTIQFSDDGQSWTDVVPNIVAGGTRRQWIDNGPPKTPSHPRGTKSRLYRVVEKTGD